MAELATFQAQANQIYDPQAAAQKASLTSGYTAEKDSLALNKTQTAQSYERALRGVDDSEKSQVSSLNQLYSQRLGGQFSGLQGNALQGLYGKDNQARADLSTSRANKLAEISGRETAALDRYNTDNSNVDAKNTSEKAKYSSENYNSAIKEEQRIAQEQEKSAQQERFHQDTINMEYTKMANSRANRASDKADKPLSAEQTTAAIRSGLTGVRGTDGHVAPGDLAQAYKDYTGAGLEPAKFWTNFKGLWNDKQSSYKDQFYAALNK